MIRFDLLMLFMLIPLLVPFAIRFFSGRKQDITFRETLVNVVALCTLSIIVWACGTYGAAMDTQILNGKVTDKKKVWVSCEHSYQCNCRQSCSGSGSSRSCHQVCSTCYEHINDWDWDVFTTVGTITIDRVDRRGSNEPPRWTAVVKGEPAAQTASYQNYLKLAPDSIVNAAKVQFLQASYPAYPQVYDYYRINRVINMANAPADFVKDLNDKLNNRLRDLSFQKEVNVVVVLTNHKNPDYMEGLRAHWLTGKKNDVVVVAKPNAGVFEWVRVFSWSKNEIFNVQLRDKLQGQKIDATFVDSAIGSTIVDSFIRRSMEEYKYLEDDFDPPVWLIVMMVIIGLVGSIIATIIALKNDYFGESYGYYRRY